jgi:UDP-2-acetamido-3-amino-2,3-dideoxy-glucuronate N-acetyltransferase
MSAVVPRIGKKGVSLGQNVFVGNKVVIGNHCKIQNNVSVYDNVTLEDGVFCGPSMVFTNVYNPRALVERKTNTATPWSKKAPPWVPTAPSFAAPPWANTPLWLQAQWSTKTCLPTPFMVGVPAKQIGWMSEFGEQLDLPLQGQAETCPHTGARYVLNGALCSVQNKSA